MDEIKVLIITPRGDGCYVTVGPNGDGLYVEMVSQAGNHVDDGVIEYSELFNWISDRRDY